MGVSKLLRVYQIQSSVRDGPVKFKVSDSQTFDEEEVCVLSILFRNLRFTRANRRDRLFENGKAKELTRFAPLRQAECSKVKTLVWMFKS